MRYVTFLWMPVLLSVFSLQTVAADPLTEAYKKEFAFLKAEKESLRRRLKELESESQTKLKTARSEVSRLQAQVLNMRSQIENIELDLDQVERENTDAAERGDLLLETMERAADTLRRYEVSLSAPSENPSVQASQIINLFTYATAAIAKGHVVRTNKGTFFLENGKQVKGSIMEVGHVATYGIATSGGGVLVPAGALRLKVWHEPAYAMAKALIGGENPPEIPMFMYESLEKPVSDKKEKTALEVIQSGGVIAWVIVVLGVISILMILMRIGILLRASSRTDKLLGTVGDMVDNGFVDDAMRALKKAKGAAARVLTATVRNLERERQHLEDLVSEAILHETPTVERFGTSILVIAAVAPLLGLLGTVTGMISTFDVITEYGTGDPKMLSGGISEALVTTELGLIVAIPSLLLGTLLSGGANSILESIERAALQIMNRADAFKAKQSQKTETAAAPADRSEAEKPGTEASPKADAGAAGEPA